MRAGLLILSGVIFSTAIAAGVIYFRDPGTPEKKESMTSTASKNMVEETKTTKKDSKMSENNSPDLTVDSNGLSKTVAVIETEKGTIRFRFYPKDAPKTTDRIIELIQEGFYNGLSFHRVVPGFVIQGGDPNGNGTGGSGKNLDPEFNSRHHIEGTVAMARAADPASADSQFYISLGQHPHLDNNYTIFGLVTEGMETVKAIQPGDKMTRVYLQ